MILERGIAPAVLDRRCAAARLDRVAGQRIGADGAVHVQIGRFYRLTELMDPGSRDLLARVKRALDPAARMNPGALGL